MTEWNWDDALAVRYEEGQYNNALEVARNALVKGLTPEFVQRITGLDLDTLKELQESLFAY